MNIRSLSSPVTVVPINQVKQASEAIKPHDAEERDADGRQPFGEKKRKITDEELEKLLKSLKAHPGVVANGLVVELLMIEGQERAILIKNASGQIVRRVPDGEFAGLLDNIDQANGRLFDKAA
jgi:uncharacterized FlaG/YvyC family protein